MLAVSIAYAGHSFAQTTCYLDVNGTTDGSGITAGGSCDVGTSIWTTVADGTGAAVAQTNNNPYVLAAGTDATGLSCTLTGTLQQPDAFTVGEGFVTINSTFDTFRPPVIQTNQPLFPPPPVRPPALSTAFTPKTIS